MAHPFDLGISMPTIIPNLHPAAVHFPIALTLMALAFSALAKFFPNSRFAEQWAVVGHWSLWLAALTAVLAVALGWQAYNTVNHDDAGHLAMTIHRNWAIPTAIALVLLAVWDGWRHHIAHSMSWGVLVLLFVVSIAIGKTAWLGGEVVYRHGIGVMTLPAAEHEATPKADGAEAEPSNAGHSHDHGHAH